MLYTEDKTRLRSHARCGLREVRLQFDFSGLPSWRIPKNHATCGHTCRGLATRWTLTETIPKSLIPIDGEPFVVYQLRLLQSSGIQHVILCIGHLGEQIERASAMAALALRSRIPTMVRRCGNAGAIRTRSQIVRAFL